MSEVVPLPQRGEVLVDARGEGRALRVSWHHEQEIVVLSLWRGTLCSASFRLPTTDVHVLINALVQGLSDGYAATARHADAS